MKPLIQKQRKAANRHKAEFEKAGSQAQQIKALNKLTRSNKRLTDSFMGAK